ncbi:ABC transporter ATP-binding protein [Flavitalea sp.]|nr:ABC transporter ATP-binding protein [Flavitalea sp.]
MSEPLLKIRDLQVDFNSALGKTTAVSNINFEVERGEIVAIVGESGSGKSVTSLSILQLLPTPPAAYPKGEILFSADGISSLNLLNLPLKELRALRGNEIAMIFQEPMSSLNPVFTCGDQVIEAIMLHQKLSRKPAMEKTIRLFEKVKLPDPASMFHRYPHQLSGGQKQRVMIAMAMSCEPSLLICDEPTTALDVTVQKTILRLIRELQATEKMGVIFITHDLGVVAEVADRAIVMYKGSIVEQGTVKDIFSHPEHPYTRGLLSCRPVLHPKGLRLPVVADFMNGTIEALPSLKLTDISTDTGTAGSIGSATGISDSYVSVKIEAANNDLVVPRRVLMKAEDINVWFPSGRTMFGKPKQYIKAVQDVSFEIFEGETLGLVGESGCGKTTLGRTLLRLIKPNSGHIHYKNQDIATLDPDTMRSMRRDLQIVFQDPYSSLNPRITIGSAIAEPLKVQGIVKQSAERKARVLELLEKVNLQPEHFARYPHEFSGGQRQRIVIARALAMNPSFLVCDESVSALDVSVQAQVLNLLNDLKKEFGFTIVFISHDLGVVRYISDRIMVMNKGRIEEIGQSEDVYHRPVSEYTRKLIDSIPGI